MSLRLLHLSNDFYPSVTGGTEIFVHQLIEAQRQLPDPPEIRWAAHGSTQPAIAVPSAEQVPLPPVVRGGRRATAGHRSAAIPGFQKLLETFRPDLLHLHSLSPLCGLDHVKAARRAGVAVVITLHAPGFTCMQGSLLYHRRTICDGVMRDGRCTECRLVNGGMPAPAAWLVSRQTGWPLSSERDGRLAHVLTGRQLTANFHAAFRDLVEQVQGIHVLAEWSRQVALANGVSPAKLQLIRTAGPPALPPPSRQPMQDGVLRLVYWGRCGEIKGLHLIIEAIRALPRQLPVELSFYGPYWDDAYGREMAGRIEGDPRFRLAGQLPQRELLPRLQNYDLAVIPSTILETGPLTVLEAWAAGLPVAGSDLGGIQELLRGRRGGFLVPVHSEGWRQLLLRLLEQPSLLQAPERPERQFQHIAADLAGFYAGVMAPASV